MRRHPGVGTVAALAALAAVGRLLFVWAPNVAATYFVVFAAGVAYGARTGAAVAVTAMVATDVLLTGLHPVVLVNAPAMALLGVAGGVVARFVDLGQGGGVPGLLPRGLAAFLGVVATVGFSVAADATSYLLFLAPSGAGSDALVALVVAGLAFNAVPAAVNGVLFAAALPPTLRAAREAGLLPARPALPPQRPRRVLPARGPGPSEEPQRR